MDFDDDDVEAFEAFKATFHVLDVTQFEDSYRDKWDGERDFYLYMLEEYEVGVPEYLDPFLDWDALIAEYFSAGEFVFVKAKDGGVFAFRPDCITQT